MVQSPADSLSLSLSLSLLILVSFVQRDNESRGGGIGSSHRCEHARCAVHRVKYRPAPPFRASSMLTFLIGK